MNLRTAEPSPRNPVPTTSADFDRAYRAPFTFWGDVRIPPQIVELVAGSRCQRVLELGSGVGRFSRHLASLGHDVVGVDFSPVAVAKAQDRVANDRHPPKFRVGDVTNLVGVEGPFDASFDVGCFHCLDVVQQSRYVAALSRLLAPGATHLIWALDRSPSDLQLQPLVVEGVFSAGFRLRQSAPSRRRLARSHWYWLERNAGERK